MEACSHSRKPPRASRTGFGEWRTPRSPEHAARDWVHLACVSAAGFALLLLALGVAYWHQDTPGSEATCAICHVAHLTPLPGAVVASISTPLLIAWYEAAESQPEQRSAVLTSASPRAPPAD